jgi:hypothetical protein
MSIKMQQCAVYILFYCNITLRVSGAVHTHQQEHIKLITATGTGHIIVQLPHSNVTKLGWVMMGVDGTRNT